MKKYLLLIALAAAALLAPKAADAQTLYQCYQQKGLVWSGVSQRAVLAAENAVWKYKGTAAQNTLLTSRLCPTDASGEAQLGFSVVTGYEKNIRTTMTATQTTIPVTSLALKDGTTIDINSFGGTVFLTIEPGTIREEISMCTGINTATINFDPCVRGLAFSGTSTASVAANRKTHNAGSKVVISNVHYVYEQFVDINSKDQTIVGPKTASGVWTFNQFPVLSSTTGIATDPAEFVTLYQLSQATSTGGGVNASTAVKGVVQKATDTQVENGTATGSTGAQTFVGADSWLTYADTHLNNSIDAGELVAARNILYVSSTGKHMIAHANVQGEIDKIDSVAFEAGCSGCSPKVYMPGSMIFDGGLSLTPGGLVYLSDTGRPSATAGTIRKVLGIAYSANNWEFNPTVDTPSAVPTANTIPISNASGTLAIGWYSGVQQTYTAGESINASSAPLAVYVSSTDGRVYKTASGAVTTTFPFIGFAVLGENKTAGQSITVQFAGNVTGFTGMTTGSIYYVSTAGTVSSTAGTINYKIGRALSPTVLYIEKGSKVYSGTTSFSSTASTVITVGFMPSKVIVNAVARSTIQLSSNGGWTANGGNNNVYTPDAGAAGGTNANAWYINTAGGLFHSGTVTSLTATGFTLSNTETSGTDTVDLVWTASE